MARICTAEKITRYEFIGPTLGAIMREVGDFIDSLEARKIDVAAIKPVFDEEGWTVSLFTTEW